MPDRTLRVILTGDSAGLVASMGEAEAATAATADSMGKNVDKAGAKTEGMFSKFGSSMSSMGIPFSNTVSKMGAELDKTTTKGQHFAQAMSGIGKATLAVGGIAAIGIGVESVKMAMTYQTALTQLVTGAGEAQKNIGMVGSAMLKMAGETGTTASQLAAGMYMIESAGYHGAAGLSVLKAAAEGAKVGNAEMATVAGAVTTALTDYHLKASDAASVTSALVETVASGKMHMQDLGLALGKVMPVASALGINFQTVTGAMAEMTNQGLSARFAATHLQTTLLALSAPSKVATASMASVGLTSQQVKNFLSEQGLGATLTMIEDHLGKKFPAGSVAYVTAMKNMLGGVTGYSTALMLSGKNSTAFADNVRNIGARLNTSSTQVLGFNKVQGDLQFQMDSAKASLNALGIQFGMFLIPKLAAAGKELSKIIGWFEKNTTAAKVLGGVITGVLGLAITMFTYNKVTKFVSGVNNMATSFSKMVTKIVSGSATAAEADTTAATTMETENAAAGASFTKMLGPIGLVTIAAIGLDKIMRKIDPAGWGGNTVASQQTKYNQMIAAAHGNLAQISKINYEAEQFNKALSMGGGTGLTGQIKITPTASAMSGTAAAASMGGGPAILEAHFNIDGREFATAMAPYNRAALLQTGRHVINVGLG